MNKFIKSISKNIEKIGGSNLGSTGLNQAQNVVFHHIIEFGSYVFFKIAHNDSLQQSLTSIGCPNFGQTG